jgi:hypothetical protein
MTTKTNAQALTETLRTLRTMERGLIEASQVVGDFHNALQAETDPAAGFQGFDAGQVEALRMNIALRLQTLNSALRSVQDDSVRAMLAAASLTAEEA